MSGIKDGDNIDDLRKRLYERGTPGVGNLHHDLNRIEKTVPTEWSDVDSEKQPDPETSGVQEIVPEVYEPTIEKFMAPKPSRRRSFRVKLIILGVMFFGAAMVISSFFLVFGRNNISGDNISIVLTTPFTVGGGEVLPIQVGIRNDNTVPMKDVQLVMEYPSGTKSAEEQPRDLFTERIQLEDIAPGETLNMPLRVNVFGEENEEKQIGAAVEYKVDGSGATLYKTAESQVFRVSSAPVSLRLDNVQKLSSGQDVNITLTIISNSPAPLSEVLVKAEYPNAFEYKGSNLDPSSGNNAWIIQNVDPETSHTINISGRITGDPSDVNVMHFSVGIPNERDKGSFASVFGTASTEFEIESAFVDVEVLVAGSSDGMTSVEQGQSAGVNITINNSLSYSIYDLKVVASISGNNFEDSFVRPGRAYYNSQADTLIFDVSNTNNLEQIDPGDSQFVSFSIDPKTVSVVNPTIDVKVDIFAHRIDTLNAAAELIGSIEKELRIDTQVSLLSAVERSNTPFVQSGPLPPVANEATTYTLAFRAENQHNSVSNGRMTATLPLNVRWLDKTTGDGRFEFNQTNRRLTWIVDNISANSFATSQAQVELTPSSSQIGNEALLFSRQTFSITDDFTGVTVQASSDDITTELPAEAGFATNNGIVQP